MHGSVFVTAVLFFTTFLVAYVRISQDAKVDNIEFFEKLCKN